MADVEEPQCGGRYRCEALWEEMGSGKYGGCGGAMSLLSYEDGVLDPSSIIPLLDGGTEGFKGNARVILPGMTACIDCTLELYPPQINFPMCTIASMPRLPEHCIEYVRILQWPKENPFGAEGVVLDGDDPEHIQWVFQKSLERAAEFKITGVTYRLTQETTCRMYFLFLFYSAYIPLNNYLVFNDVDGLYTYTFEAERKENCSACSQVPQKLQFSSSAKLQEVLDYLTENASFTRTKATAGNGQSVGSPPDSPAKPHAASSKDLILESKDTKSEDRQSNTPSPPVSTFSSGTSTTSDIEVLDHDSVISESSASSRQESAESKASLHLMQTSFQLLSASACSDFQRLDDYQKLTESSGSSDAFERIDSFSMQSLDSRSVSEINSDDELPGRACTLASVTSSPPSSTPLAADPELNDTVKDRSLEENEMEESCRSATPVNCEEPEELVESDQASSVFWTVTNEPEQTPVHPTSEEGQANQVYHNLQLQKVIDELTIILEKRETQILAVSKDKARLEEDYDNLKDEMINLKEECCSVQSLKEEFTQRIADAEKKAQLACKEKDALKKEVKTLKEELSTRLNSNETAEIMKEKDEQIKGLLEEGEKLSKQQLHNSNSIKKLRVKDKENEGLLSKQSKKIKELEEELKHLQQVLDGKEEVERQHRESIKKLNGVVERQEKELSRHLTDLEEYQETNRSLQAALDNSYKELAELHRANATKDSKAQEAALSREIQAKEQLSVALEKAQEESRMQQEVLAMQVRTHSTCRKLYER
ncbi:UNVERIFIED_CONTAM: hypothetical protein FKN15_070472 [Acipenser sinensis]